MEILLSKKQLEHTVIRLAHQILENDEAVNDIVFVGIQPRGVALAEKMRECMQQLMPETKFQYAVLDITFYRDDVREEIHLAKETIFPFSIEGKKVILIDDVLYTGRTIRAALDALQDYGRPEKVELCVLINRRFSRQLPIQPDYCGKLIDTQPDQKIKADWDKGEVYIY